MMPIQPTLPENMLLALLRASLHEEKTATHFFEHATEKDWLACYKLAGEQGVTALAWDGVTMLPRSLFPPLGIKVSWELMVAQQEKRYARHCHALAELSELYAVHGIATLQFKGIGFSAYYPKPQHREGGDIDIYTYSADPKAMSDEEAHDLSDRLIHDKNQEVETANDKHSLFFCQDVPIENHRTFLDVTEWKFAIDAEKDLHHLIQPHYVSLPVSTAQPAERIRILVPSDAFNTLYIPIHAIRHYTVGLSLHHLCDWACLLNHSGLHLPDDMNDPRYQNLIRLFTAFTNKYLGTNVELATKGTRNEETTKEVPNNQTEETKNETGSTQANIQKNGIGATSGTLDELYLQLFRSPYRDGSPSKNPLRIFMFRIGRFIHYRLMMKRLLGESILVNSWMVFLRRIRKPSEMFKL